jgi:hypothetical protein
VLLLFNLLIAVHELGHFLAAKWRGLKIDRFAVWFGTPLLFYMYVAPPFSHACSAFAVAIFVAIWVKVRRTWSLGGIAALGLAAALMAMVREQDIFCALGPVLDFVLSFLRQRRQRRAGGAVAGALVGALAFFVGYLPQLIAYQALNGFPRPSPLVMRKMFWYSPHALQVLADPEHGFLFWTPLALLALVGLVLIVLAPGRVVEAPRGATNTDVRQVGSCMLLMVAMQVYVSGAVESWTVAGAFGQRRFVAVTIFLVVGLAAWRRAAGASSVARIATNIVIAVCVWWNLALTLEFGTSMHRPDPVPTIS